MKWLSSCDKLIESLPMWVRRAAVALLLVLAGAACLHRISARSMWLDELSHRDIGRMPVTRLLNDPTLSVQPAHGYYLINRTCEKIFGEIEFSNRLPQAVCAILSVLFVYLLGRHLFSTGAGLIAALGLAVNPFFIQYAQQNRNYQMGSLGFLVVYYFYCRFLETRRWLYWIGLVLAASFALRTHSYGMVTVAMLVPVTCVLLLLYHVPRVKLSPYDMSWQTVRLLLLAALVIGILWLPYPLRLMQYVTTSKTAPAFDGFWTGPFPLSATDIVRYAFDNFVIMSADEKARYLMPLLAAVIGGVVFKRGRSLVFLLFFIVATLPVLYAMNNAKAAVMPKRFIYFLPSLYLFVAGGLAMIVEALSAGVGWALRRVTANRWVLASTSMALRCVCWTLLLWLYVWPVYAKDLYQLGSYYHAQYRVVYREVAQLLTAHARMGDVLWWYPPVNDAWLLERYLPAASLIFPQTKHTDEVTRETITRALEQHAGLWLYGIDPAGLGYRNREFIDVPIAEHDICLFRAEYATNEVVRNRDAVLLLKSVVNISAYPEVRTVGELSRLLLCLGDTNAADRVANELARWPASPDATKFLVEYYHGRGRQDLACVARCALADVYFWLPVPQIEAARAAQSQRRYDEAIRMATRAYWLSFGHNAEAAQILGQAYAAQGKHALAERWLRRAADMLSHAARKGAVEQQQMQAISSLRQQVLRSGGHDAAVLAAWLQGWCVNTGLHSIHAFTNILEDARREPRRWARFAREARAAGIPAALRYLPEWYAARGTAAAEQPAHAIAKATTATTWPVYCFVLDNTPTNMRGAMVIAPSNLPSIGFNPTEWWDAALLWFEAFYSKNAGLSAALAYWDMVDQTRSNFTAVAVINQAKLEMQQRHTSNAVARIAAHVDALNTVPWTRQRAEQMLRLVPGPDTARVLTNLLAAPSTQ